jgi:uracil-DNA glycosylase
MDVREKLSILAMRQSITHRVPAADQSRGVATLHRLRAELYYHATQTLFGEGPVNAKLVLVCEQPADREDIEDRSFVMPAEHLLQMLLDRVGIHRDEVNITKAVKQFKIRTARKAATAQKAKCARNFRVSPLARSRNELDQAARDCVPLWYRQSSDEIFASRRSKAKL